MHNKYYWGEPERAQHKWYNYIRVYIYIGYNHHIPYKCYSNLANYSIAQAHEHEEGGVLATMLATV